MFTKPDLLFINDVREVVDETLDLSVAKAVHAGEKRKQLQSRRFQDGYYHSSESPLKALNSDLVYAFTPSVPVFTFPEFAHDLNLELIVNNFFGTTFTQKFQYHVLSHAPVDIATIHYRWKILDELVEQEPFVKALRDLALQFTHMYEVSLKRHEKIDLVGLDNALITERNVLELLLFDYTIAKEYIAAVKAMHKAFEHAQSRGLQQLRIYAERIIGTDDFKELDEMITRYDNAQYVELGITSTALGYIHRLRFLGEGKNQLPRSWLRNLHPRRLPKAVDKLDTRKYNELLVRVFEGFITEMEQQIFNTVYLTGDFEFYTGAMNYRKVLLDSNLPVTRPTLLDKSLRRHRLKNMYHPLIKKDTWHEPTCQDPRFWIYREKVVPNSFESDPEHNLFLLAAINEGGKSRYSTAVGSFIDLGQSGLWVPAEEAEISLVDNIFTHFVHGDNVDQGSRWIEEIERMNTLLFRTTPNSLSIIDDFGSGTNYLETRKPALNAVYGHYRLGATLIMNTHLHELAKDAESGLFPGISVLQIEIKKEGEVWKPTYRVIPGRAGTSHAAEIAEQHGLSKEAIDDMIDTRIAESGLPAELIHPAKLIEIPR